MTTAKSKWLKANIDVAVCLCAFVVCASIAITSLVAVVLVLITRQDFRGDFVWVGAKFAFWACFNLGIASLLHENRRLKAIVRRSYGGVR